MRKVTNLLGQRFGRLTVVEFKGTNKGRMPMWLCQCTCGNTTIVQAGSLNNGHTKSCGCLNKEIVSKLHARIKIGDKYGRLTVVKKRSELNSSSGIYYECLCDCNNTSLVQGGHLRNGSIQSCGCYRNKNVKLINIIHGMSYTKIYRANKTRKYRELKRKLDFQWIDEMTQALKIIQPGCVICGKEFDFVKGKIQELAIDHVLPLSKDNPLIPGNAVRLCLSCNSIKRARNLDSLPDGWKEIILSKANEFKEYCKQVNLFEEEKFIL